MSLLFPLGLLALLSALLPLLIHLARRHPYTPLDFAALRWLRAQVRPRQRIRFDDWPLLLVRVALLAALALLLAGPALTGPAPATATWTVVAPGLDAQALRAAGDESRWHWLAPGFPAIEQPVQQQAALPSLLRELDAQLPAGTALVVHVPDPLPGLDGQRLQLSRPVQWQPHPQVPAPVPTVARGPVLRLHGKAPGNAQRWLAALQHAWTQAPLLPALTGDDRPEAGQVGVWSSAQPLPASWQAWLQDGGTVLSAAPASEAASVLLRNAQGAAVLLQQKVGNGRLLHLAGPWDAAANPALRDAQLPRQLQWVLQGVPTAQLGDATDHAPVQAALPASAPPLRELAPWLMALIVLLFALERWLASAPRRRHAP